MEKVPLRRPNAGVCCYFRAELANEKSLTSPSKDWRVLPLSRETRKWKKSHFAVQMWAFVASFALGSQMKKVHFAVQGRASAPSFARNSQMEKVTLRSRAFGASFALTSQMKKVALRRPRTGVCSLFREKLANGKSATSPSKCGRLLLFSR